MVGRLLKTPLSAALVAMVLLGGLLSAAAGAVDGDTVFTGCRKLDGVIIKVWTDSEPARQCKPWQTLLTWNVEGPPGSAGADGLPGVDGQDGQDGAPGLDGADGQDVTFSTYTASRFYPAPGPFEDTFAGTASNPMVSCEPGDLLFGRDVREERRNFGWTNGDPFDTTTFKWWPNNDRILAISDELSLSSYVHSGGVSGELVAFNDGQEIGEQRKSLESTWSVLCLDLTP